MAMWQRQLVRAPGVLAAAVWLTLAVAPAVRAQGADAPEPGLAGQPVLPADANTLCPVTTDEPVDPAFFTSFEGRTVYFCCRRCRTKFEADPALYLANLPPLPAPDAASDTEPTAADAPHHDHDHDHDAAGFQLLPYLGRFHVLTVHFPIVLLILAGAVELSRWGRPAAGGAGVLRPLIALGAVSAVVAMLLGLANALEEDPGGTLDWVFWWHRALGIATAALAVAAWLAVEWRARRPGGASATSARVLVLLAAALVMVTGHFGGSLVFGWNYLVP